MTTLRITGRQINKIMLVKCNDNACFSNWKYQIFSEILQTYKMRMIALTLSATYEGHDNKFLQFGVYNSHEFGNGGQRHVKTKNLVKCPKCPAYNF